MNSSSESGSHRDKSERCVPYGMSRHPETGELCCPDCSRMRLERKRSPFGNVVAVSCSDCKWINWV